MSLATIQTLVDDKMRGAALGTLYSTDGRDRAIAQALLQYSTDAPQELVKLVANVSGSTIALPTGWVAGESMLQGVEYPLDTVPTVSLLAASARYDGAQWAIVLADALGGVDVRVHFTAPHANDASTVPARDENALACWAAAELCRQLATKAGHDRDASVSAVAQNAQSQSGELARRAKEWLAQYRQLLGLPDPDKALDGGGQAAASIVSWGSVRLRGRFSSLGA